MTPRSLLLAVALVCTSASVGRAALTTADLAEDVTDVDLATALVGGAQGIVVSNVTHAGAATALGAFTGGPACLGFDAGVILSSGSVASAAGPNDSFSRSDILGTPGDAALNAIVNGSTLDAAVLEFDVTPPAGTDTIAFQYVFASDEYNTFVGSGFNDVFALFVNGVNYALVPDTTTAVSINTVNHGNGAIPASNPVYYVDNEFMPAPCDVQPDGFTVVLTLVAPVVPNEANHLKLAIADRGDARYNSWVFIKGGSIVAGNRRIDLHLQKLAPEGSVSVGSDTSWLLHYANAGPDTATGVVITDTLPADTTFVRADPPICSAAGATVTCNVGTLPPVDEDEDGEHTLTIVTSSTTAGEKTNTAVIQATDTGQIDLFAGNDAGSATVTLGCDDGKPCDDRNACTQTDVCQGGVCVGTNPKTCAPADACHVAGVCEPTTGLCTNPPGNDGARCGDGNVCNGDEVCETGLCVAPTTAQALACEAKSFTGFVSNFASNSVSILDPQTSTLVGELPVPNGPWGVAINPAGTEVWVTERSGRAVTILDPTTRAVVGSIPVGGTPLGVAIHPNGTRAYVANYDDDRITVIDMATRQPIANIPVAAGPSAFAFNAAGTRLYVSGYAANALSVLDTASNAVIGTVPTGKQPLGLALDRSRGRLYVTNYAGASVTVVGTVSHTVLATIPAGQHPFGVAVDAARARVYVTNASSDSITVIDGAGLGVVHTITDVGRAPFGVGLDLTGTRAFVANAGDNTIALIDTSALAVTAKKSAAQQPIAFGAFLGSIDADCPLPAPVCTDADPTTSESCSAVDGCLYVVRSAGGALASTLETIAETIQDSGAATLGGAAKAAFLGQQIAGARGQLTSGIVALTDEAVQPSAARASTATRKHLKRIDRALGKVLRALQKGLKKRTVARDLGLRLLDLVRAAESATQAAIGGRAVAVAPSHGLLTPLVVSRPERPAPPLP